MYNLDHWARFYNDSLKKPWKAQTHENVKHIATNGIADGHVSVTLFDHCHTWEAIGNTDTCSNEGEAHDRVGNAHGEPDHGDHPHHHVAVQTNPSDWDEEW